MKTIQKMHFVLTLAVMFLAFFAFFSLFIPKNEQKTEIISNYAPQIISIRTEKTKPIISINYANNLCEFVYDGNAHHLNASINSDQKIEYIRIMEEGEIEVKNEFVEIGEYKIKITAKSSETFSEPDPVNVVVRVLPRVLTSDKTSGKIEKIEIIKDEGFCLESSYNATSLSKKQKRTIKKALRKKLEYTEEIIEIANVSPNSHASNNDTVAVSLKLSQNAARLKNFRIFEYTSFGELKEISYVLNRGSFTLSEIPTSSFIIVSADKQNPYLWIWIMFASISFVGLIVAIYLFAPRKLNFYLEGQKIYVAKVNRRQTFSLCDGLENYEWYLDPNMTIKVNDFGVWECSKNYYAKIVRHK